MSTWTGNSLWHHFGRFNRSVAGIDPRVENFQPAQPAHQRLRVYALKGKKTWIAWLRDAQSDWKTELLEGQAPALLPRLKLELPSGIPNRATIRIYDPWKDRWTTRKATRRSVALPDFTRSLVVRVGY